MGCVDCAACGACVKGCGSGNFTTDDLFSFIPEFGEDGTKSG